MVRTPLTLTLDHKTEVRDRAHNMSVEVKKGKCQIFCMTEWLTFSVDWPPTHRGLFNGTMILDVKAVVFKEKLGGHPDQKPYI